ncbi:MAG: recombination mediator RecR [Candidatus Marinimicrobia bacterium]|jgi:recombination protein RecR|nr:recombination mediator RecR [Candidatus Neomarinimicrobiota bacterium]
MSKVTLYIEQLVESLTKFPGVGRKGAERIAYFIVRSNKSVAQDLTISLDNISDKLSNCDNCGMIFLKEDGECSCNSNRNATCICVVENVEDAVKIENTHSYDGLYHVLGGAISPLDGIGPSELSFDKLLKRIDSKVEEIIIATNPSTSGNATAMYLEKILKDKKVTISRLAVGLPVGSNLEYIDDKTVTTAIEGRVKLN